MKLTSVGASLLAIFLVLFLGAASGRATELTDLGEGLSYLRVHAFDDTAKALTAAVRERESLVLDLRHATVTAESAESLRSALAARPAKQPVFILVGPATPPALAAALNSAPAHCVTFGVKESVPIPQVVIDQSADADQRAYDALESGQPLAKLISGKIDKERYDESVLMKEFISGNINAAPPAEPDPTIAPTETAKPSAPPTKTGETPAAKTPEPLIDRVLQRAVQLHRALAAIKQR